MQNSQKASVTANSNTVPMGERQRALDILAKSLYKELRAQGFEEKHVVNLATALLGQVTDKANTRKAS